MGVRHPTTTQPGGTLQLDEYPKIYGPYERDTSTGPNRNLVIPDRWSRPEFAHLANTPWIWTEKVDGTNIRVGWDGHKVEFGGRTDNAQIPVKLLSHLRDTFTEELFEQAFGGSAATLYGEGFGAGIQKGGGRYAPAPGFILFDVRIGPFWLLRDAVVDISQKLGIPVVPVVLTDDVPAAIKMVRLGVLSAWAYQDAKDAMFEAEGLVGVPASGLLDRAGRRIMMKVKAADFGPDARRWTP
jgi:hypothetical protein